MTVGSALFRVYNFCMPPVTITLTEMEACHVRELIEKDRDDLKELSHRYVLPEWLDSHKGIIELDEGLLVKFKDA